MQIRRNLQTKATLGWFIGWQIFLEPTGKVGQSKKLSTAHKLEGWKALVALEVARPEIEPGSLAQKSETLTTKPRHLGKLIGFH